MRIEFNSLPANGDGEVQVARRRENALEFFHPVKAPVGVYRLPVSPQSDVLHHVEAGKRVHALVRKRKMNRVDP